MPYFLGRGRKARRAYGFDEIALVWPEGFGRGSNGGESDVVESVFPCAACESLQGRGVPEKIGGAPAGQHATEAKEAFIAHAESVERAGSCPPLIEAFPERKLVEVAVSPPNPSGPVVRLDAGPFANIGICGGGNCAIEHVLKELQGGPGAPAGGVFEEVRPIDVFSNQFILMLPNKILRENRDVFDGGGQLH